MTQEEFKEVLRLHDMWVRGEEGGEKGNLQCANLRCVDLTGVNLERIDFQGADLWGAIFRGSNLLGVNFSDANLRFSDFRGSHLRGANLSGADLLCFGNARELRTMQISTWLVGYTADTLQIDCYSHPIDKWRKWNTEAGRKLVEQMDSKTLEWADRNLALILQIIDANPATPTGHEKEDRG